MILGIEKPDKGCVTLNDLPMHKKKVRRQKLVLYFKIIRHHYTHFRLLEKLFEVMCQCDGQPKELWKSKQLHC